MNINKSHGGRSGRVEWTTDGEPSQPGKEDRFDSPSTQVISRAELT